jgi:hypothetical protein
MSNSVAGDGRLERDLLQISEASEHPAAIRLMDSQLKRSGSALQLQTGPSKSASKPLAKPKKLKRLAAMAVS